MIGYSEFRTNLPGGSSDVPVWSQDGQWGNAPALATKTNRIIDKEFFSYNQKWQK
jgi:hypothetical protein